MTKNAIYLALFCLASLPAFGQSPSVPIVSPSPPAEDEIIKVTTDLITTPVSVLDRHGRFIPGLKKRDFTKLRLSEIERLVRLHRLITPPLSRRALIALCEDGTFETAPKQSGMAWLVFEDSFLRWVKGLDG